MRPLVKSVAQYTLTSKARRFAMIRALQATDRDGIPGDVVECGVWRGGNIILARKVSPDRVCWLYDTFTGMTVPGPEDRRCSSGKLAAVDYAQHERNHDPWCLASVDEVKRCLVETGTYDETRLRFVIGEVEKTLLDPGNLPERIAVLRLDTDWYLSTKIELEVLYPRLAIGGVCIVDDFGHWTGARRAVNDYFAGCEPVFDEIDYSAVMFVKDREINGT